MPRSAIAATAQLQGLERRSILAGAGDRKGVEAQVRRLLRGAKSGTRRSLEATAA